MQQHEVPPGATGGPMGPTSMGTTMLMCHLFTLEDIHEHAPSHPNLKVWNAARKHVEVTQNNIRQLVMRLDILQDGSSERTIELSCRCAAFSICPPIHIVDANGYGKADVNNGAQHAPESLELAELMYTEL
eukprot:13692735-Alexandrium_andersonii.AAC.1